MAQELLQMRAVRKTIDGGQLSEPRGDTLLQATLQGALSAEASGRDRTNRYYLIFFLINK